jgi:hypothetical protein
MDIEEFEQKSQQNLAIWNLEIIDGNVPFNHQ